MERRYILHITHRDIAVGHEKLIKPGELEFIATLDTTESYKIRSREILSLLSFLLNMMPLSAVVFVYRFNYRLSKVISYVPFISTTKRKKVTVKTEQETNTCPGRTKNK